MVEAIRDQFNRAFTAEKYRKYLTYLEEDFPGSILFRVAETPVFIDKDFADRMLAACTRVLEAMLTPEFIRFSAVAVPSNKFIPGEEGHPHFICFDFGICRENSGRFIPMLVEMQAFPSLFAYQLQQYDAARRVFQWPERFTPFFNRFREDDIISLLGEIILADTDPENVILLELFPHKQKTRIDFYYTEKYLGVTSVCVTEVRKEGRKLFYYSGGRKIWIKRIYNRLILDELFRQPPEVQAKAKWIFEEVDVAWLTHPNWFYRISKHALPFLNDPNVPETFFLKDLDHIPLDLKNYVLKPLFSFAGNGVLIDVHASDIRRVKDKENYILQRKVQYAPVIKTPDGNAKGEIRVFYLWRDGQLMPVATHNLARLTKGNMINVTLNRDKTWVGGSFALFEK